MTWEWDLHHLVYVHVGAVNKAGLCDVKLCFCSSPNFATRKYSLGQRQWRTEMPPGFLAGLMREPVLTVTVKPEKIATALQQLVEVNPDFAIDPTLDIIQSVQTHDSGYSMPLLVTTLKRVQEHVFVKFDNQSELVRVLRMPTSDGKESALSDIVAQCDNIVRVAKDPGYTHPMLCCCCGRETELDIDTGLRVLKETRKVHYVCECIVPYIKELECGTKHPGFPTFRRILLRLHGILNPQ